MCRGAYLRVPILAPVRGVEDNTICPDRPQLRLSAAQSTQSFNCSARFPSANGHLRRKSGGWRPNRPRPKSAKPVP